MRPPLSSVALLCCFASFLTVQSTPRPSSPQPPDPPKDAYKAHYANDAQRISNKFTNAELLKLGWRYHPTNVLSNERLRKIENPLIRCKSSHPDANRQLRVGSPAGAQWTYAPETNAEFVDGTRKRRKEMDQKRAEKDKRQRQDVFEKTGVWPLTHQTKLRMARLERAKQAAPDGVFTVFKTGHNTHELKADPRSRTNSQYIAQERARVKRYNDKARERRRAAQWSRTETPMHSTMPPSSTQASRVDHPSQATAHSAPEGRGDHRFESWWSDLHDLR